MCCRRIFDRIKGDLAEIQPKNHQSVQKYTLFAKSSRSQWVKNTRIKQPCKRKVRDFAMALRVRKVSGTFEKRDTAAGRPGPSKENANTGSNRTEDFPRLQPSSQMRFVSRNKNFLDFIVEPCILFRTKSCHPDIGSNIASNGIKHLLSIKIMIPHKLNLQTIREHRIKNNFRID